MVSENIGLSFWDTLYTDFGCPVIEVNSFQRIQQSMCLPPFHMWTGRDPVSETLIS
jgi:hypothetical protein